MTFGNLVPLTQDTIKQEPDILKRVELGELVIIEWGGVQYIYNKSEEDEPATTD